MFSLASSTLEKVACPKDECDHFGAMVACQLRSLPEHQRSLAMLQFSQLIHNLKYPTNINHFSSMPSPSPAPAPSATDVYNHDNNTAFTYHQFQ